MPAAPSARRLRLLVVGTALFAGAVLLTGLPVSALLAQHKQLGTTGSQLQRLQAADRSLEAQSKRLTDGSTVAGLARMGYGLVPPGQKAYVILPPPGSSASAIAGSGHVPLEGPPVAPGSAESQQLIGVAPAGPSASSGGSSSAGATPDGGHGGHQSASSEAGSAAAPGSFWARVVHSLEFWR